MKKGIILTIIGVILLMGCLVIHYLYSDQNKSIIDVRIKDIEIDYYPGYNIATAEAINDLNKNGNFVDEIKIKVTGDDFDNLSKLISELKVTDYDFSSCNCAYIMDEYLIVVNDEYTLSLGNEFGLYSSSLDNKIFSVPKELDELISKKMNEYNNENLYKELKFTNAYIEENNSKIELSEELNKLKEYKYFLVNENDDYLNYDGGYKYIIVLDDNTKIYIYNSNIAYIDIPNELSSFVMFTSSNKTSIDRFVKNTVQNRKLDLSNKLKTNIIKVEYNDNNYNITDTNTINDAIEELKYLSYNNFPYLDNMTEESIINSGVIKIIINDCKYYIPTSVGIGNRYFIDKDGIIYDVGELTNTKFEKYVKELVGYKEGEIENE